VKAPLRAGLRRSCVRPTLHSDPAIPRRRALFDIAAHVVSGLAPKCDLNVERDRMPAAPRESRQRPAAEKAQTMRRMRFAVATTLFLLPALSARADFVIKYDTGGFINDYIERYETIRANGVHVVVEGVCLSACTMVLGIVPRENVCVTSRAQFGFHAAFTKPKKVTLPSPDGSRRLMEHYAPDVRSWVTRHGGLTSRVLVLKGAELARMVSSCDARSASRWSGN
jgi:hypothetical protein